MNKLKNFFGLVISIIALMIFSEYGFLLADMPQSISDISMSEVKVIYVTNVLLLFFLILYNIILFKTHRRSNIGVLMVSLFCSFMWYISYPRYFSGIDSGLLYIKWSVYFVCTSTNILHVSSQIVYAILYYTKYKNAIEETINVLQW